MKKKLLVLGILVVGVGVWLAFRGGEPAAEATGDDEPGKTRMIGGAGRLARAREQIDAAAAAITNGTRRRAERRVRIAMNRDDESLWVFEDGRPWPDDQKLLMRTIIAAADMDDFREVAALASQVAKCENSEVREKFVDELGWFGEQAFVELANFISDPNEEVSDAARTQIIDSFQEIDSDTEKAALFKLMSRAVTDDDLLDTFSDELTVMDEVLALQTIVDTIADGTSKAAEVAMAAYESITDEKWDNIDAAEAWLADNYEGDDDSDDDVRAVTQRTAGNAKKSSASGSSSRSRSSRGSGLGVADVGNEQSNPPETADGADGAPEECDLDGDGDAADADDVDAQDELDGDAGDDLDVDGDVREEGAAEGVEGAVEGVEGEAGEVDEFGNPIARPPAPVLVQ